MPRVTIQQFRAALANGADQSPLTRAYRQIARGSASGAEKVGSEWLTWPPALATAGGWIPWDAQPASAAASERQAGARFAAWGDWAAPPATAA
ncbi:MAG: hypothetical protein ACJ8GN_24435 [Longimicrobiaceae bacterium]